MDMCKPGYGFGGGSSKSLHITKVQYTKHSEHTSLSLWPLHTTTLTLSCMLTSAPLSNSIFTHSMWPLSEAIISAVHPYYNDKNISLWEYLQYQGTNRDKPYHLLRVGQYARTLTQPHSSNNGNNYTHSNKALWVCCASFPDHNNHVHTMLEGH